MLDDLTRQEYEKDLFQIVERSVISYEQKNNVTFSVTIEMDLNVQKYER